MYCGSTIHPPLALAIPALFDEPARLSRYLHKLWRGWLQILAHFTEPLFSRLVEIFQDFQNRPRCYCCCSLSVSLSWWSRRIVGNIERQLKKAIKCLTLSDYLWFLSFGTFCHCSHQLPHDWVMTTTCSGMADHLVWRYQLGNLIAGCWLVFHCGVSRYST